MVKTLAGRSAGLLLVEIPPPAGPRWWAAYGAPGARVDYFAAMVGKVGQLAAGARSGSSRECGAPGTRVDYFWLAWGKVGQLGPGEQWVGWGGVTAGVSSGESARAWRAGPRVRAAEENR